MERDEERGTAWTVYIEHNCASMLHHWAATKGSANYLPDADLNRNGVIDTGDVIVALHNYYKSI